MRSGVMIRFGAFGRLLRNATFLLDNARSANNWRGSTPLGSPFGGVSVNFWLTLYGKCKALPTLKVSGQTVCKRAHYKTMC
jgi:hypothetical protein